MHNPRGVWSPSDRCRLTPLIATRQLLLPGVLGWKPKGMPNYTQTAAIIRPRNWEPLKAREPTWASQRFQSGFSEVDTHGPRQLRHGPRQWRRATPARPEQGPHGSAEAHLTTNQGIRVSDNQNSLKSGGRGPTLLEDFVLREKIFHFDHERIPERIVHARGSAAHGYFEATDDISDLSKAALFRKARRRRYSLASPLSPAVPGRSTRRATCAASR